MKKFYFFSAAFFLGLCTLALAGAGPESAVVTKGCHGRAITYVPMAESGCHGQRALLAPAVEAECGCHGRGRLTLAERRIARNAARANYQTTLAQFQDAARRGSLSAVSVSAPPTMQVVEVVEEVKCECKCNPCKCKDKE